MRGLGITDEELGKLASLYEVGQTLWRVPVEHLTPWDYNWPFGPPPGAGPPAGGGGGPGPPTPSPDCEGGSIIDCQNQTLHEHLDVSGAPFDLHYGSDAERGRKASRTLDIPLSPAAGDGGPIQSIRVRVDVAGRAFSTTLQPPPQWTSANDTFTFTWDGKDAYGRPVIGEQEARYTVCYRYEPFYYATVSEFNASFGSAGGGSGSTSAGPGRNMIEICRGGKGTVASWDDRGQGLGGWTPDILHQYDPQGKSLQLGNGDWRAGDGIAFRTS